MKIPSASRPAHGLRQRAQVKSQPLGRPGALFSHNLHDLTSHRGRIEASDDRAESFMNTSTTYLAVVTAALSSALLTGAALPVPSEGDQSQELETFEQALTDGGYDEVACGALPFNGNEAIVPDLTAEGTFWVVGSLTADVGESRLYSDLTHVCRFR